MAARSQMNSEKPRDLPGAAEEGTIAGWTNRPACGAARTRTSGLACEVLRADNSPEGFHNLSTFPAQPRPSAPALGT
jgi:hypothetical protein